MDSVPRLNIVAIGGAHQFAHFLPVAFALHAAGDASVKIFVPTFADAEAVDRLAARLGTANAPTDVMVLPKVVERLLKLGLWRLHKAVRLIAWRRRLRTSDGLLSAERTSTLLKRLPGGCPIFLHIPHGAGDRAVGFEKRLSLFDHVITAGEKDRHRMIADGVVDEDKCHVGGPIKLDALLGDTPAPKLFDNDRPVILYNPHFVEKLGSFAHHAEPLIKAVVADGRYNLIVAPHVRLGQGFSEAQRARWEALSVPGRVVVDMGSERSIDMTYTRAADLYLGDVSSQVYEFLVQPRPCAFINAHGVDWQQDPDYAMWQFGPVAEPGADLIDTIDRAFASHDDYLAIQTSRVADALQLGAGVEGIKGTVDRVAGLVLRLIKSGVPSGR